MLNRTMPCVVVVVKTPGAVELLFERQHQLDVVSPPGTDPHPLTWGFTNSCVWVALFAIADKNTLLYLRD